MLKRKFVEVETNVVVVEEHFVEVDKEAEIKKEVVKTEERVEE